MGMTGAELPIAYGRSKNKAVNRARQVTEEESGIKEDRHHKPDHEDSDEGNEGERTSNMKDMAEPGRLLLCATPIGNLEDMTPRVIAAMREADVIAAEDTRNTIKLLNHFDIHTPMVSYHEYNKFERADELRDGRCGHGCGNTGDLGPRRSARSKVH